MKSLTTFAFLLVALSLKCKGNSFFIGNTLDSTSDDTGYVFTPNGDGINDYFKINISNLETVSCKIFNGWGLLVAELKAPKDTWDGRTTSGVECVGGVYYFVLYAVEVDNKIHNQKGFIQLIK